MREPDWTPFTTRDDQVNKVVQFVRANPGVKVTLQYDDTIGFLFVEMIEGQVKVRDACPDELFEGAMEYTLSKMGEEIELYEMMRSR